MYYFSEPEPTNRELAVAYLDDFKAEHFLSPALEIDLLDLITDYFFIRKNGNPVIASIKWIEEIRGRLASCTVRASQH